VKLSPVDWVTACLAARTGTSFCEGTGDWVFGFDFADGWDGVYVAWVGILCGDWDRKECEKKERKE